jgi:hypothetical protein
MSTIVKTAINPYQDQEFLERAFLRLCEIRRTIQELQKEEETIREWAQFYAEQYLLQREKSGMFEVDGQTVSVSVNFRKVFQYPDEIVKMEEELKRRKNPNLTAPLNLSLSTATLSSSFNSLQQPRREAGLISQNSLYPLNKQNFIKITIKTRNIFNLIYITKNTNKSIIEV